MVNNNNVQPGAAAPPHSDSAYALISFLYQSLIDKQMAGDFFRKLAKQLSVDVVSLAFEVDGALVSYGTNCETELFVHQGSASLTTTFKCAKGVAGHLEIYPLLKHPGELRSCADDVREPGVQCWSLIWQDSSTRVELVIEPKNPCFDPLAFANYHRELLDYFCPHLPAAYSIFRKQEVRAPRLNGVHTLHAMFPLPLVVVHPLDCSLTPNSQALRLMNTEEPEQSANCTDKWQRESHGSWNFQRIGRNLHPRRSAAGSSVSTMPRVRGAAARRLSGASRLPTHKVPWLGLGARGGSYEVHLISTPGITSVGINERLLRTCFGLSAAEARICASAMEGRSPQDIAAQLGISINTVKARLKSIYRAIGVSSIAQLITRLYFHPAFWAANYEQAPTHAYALDLKHESI